MKSKFGVFMSIRWKQYKYW